jgi:hypothetical protein
MAKLKSHVYVISDAGEVCVFGPESEVPAWAQEKITNPESWEEAPEKAESEAPEEAPEKAESEAPEEAPGKAESEAPKKAESKPAQRRSSANKE